MTWKAKNASWEHAKWRMTLAYYSYTVWWDQDGFVACCNTWRYRNTMFTLGVFCPLIWSRLDYYNPIYSCFFSFLRAVSPKCSSKDLWVLYQFSIELQYCQSQITIYATEPYGLFLFHTFFFHGETWHITHNSAASILVGDSGSV